MTAWTFQLVLEGIELTDEQLNALFAAGCVDATFVREPDGRVLGFFDREAPSWQDALSSAVVDVVRANIGARVTKAGSIPP